MTDARPHAAPLDEPRSTSPATPSFLRPPLLRPLAVTFVIAASLAGFWGYLKTGDPRPAFESAVDGVTASIGTGVGLEVGFDLLDHHGRAVSVANFAGAPLLVVFGYTGCPDVCPTTLVEVASVLDDLEAQGVTARGAFITLDPARDTPEVLASYVEAFHPRLSGLSGDESSLREAARRFRVFYEKVDDDPEDYLIDHSAYVYLLGADGSLLSYYHPDLAAETISRDVQGRLRRAL